MPEFAISALGIIEAGCIVSSLNPIYTVHEIHTQIINANIKLLICANMNYKTVQEAVALSKRDIKIICIKMDTRQPLEAGVIDFYGLVDPLTNTEFYKPTSMPDYNDTVFLPYSSGTTGLPKGVCLTHRNIVSNVEMLHVDLGPEPLGLPTTKDYQEVVPCVLPFYHIYGWTCCFLANISLGCKIITLPNFQPDTFLKTLEQHKATLVHLVPPIGKILCLG